MNYLYDVRGSHSGVAEYSSVLGCDAVYICKLPTFRVIVVPISSGSSSSLAYGPYSLTSTSFRMTAHIDLSSAFFLRLLTPIDFRSFSILSNHLNFGLPAILLPSGFPRNAFFMVLSSDILSRWPANSSSSGSSSPDYSTTWLGITSQKTWISQTPLLSISATNFIVSVKPLKCEFLGNRYLKLQL